MEITEPGFAMHHLPSVLFLTSSSWLSTHSYSFCNGCDQRWYSQFSDKAILKPPCLRVTCFDLREYSECYPQKLNSEQWKTRTGAPTSSLASTVQPGSKSARYSSSVQLVVVVVDAEPMAPETKERFLSDNDRLHDRNIRSDHSEVNCRDVLSTKVETQVVHSTIIQKGYIVWTLL